MDETLAMKEAEQRVKLGEDLEKLKQNYIFKKIFINGYFKDEAARIATALTNPAMQDEIDQRSLDEMLRAIGHIQNYLMNISTEARIAKSQIDEHKQSLIEEQLHQEKEITIDPITGDECVVDNA